MLKEIMQPRWVSILGFRFSNLSLQELLSELQQGVVFTPNVDHLMKLRRDPEFRQAYQGADYRLCDSQILMYAARFLNTPLKEKLSGSDVFPAFCNYHGNNPEMKIFLLGAAEGVAQKALENINWRVGRELVVAAHSPSFGFEKNAQECAEIVQLINQSGANVLAVGVGPPKQEKWIWQYKSQLPNVKIFMAIGATIDFEAGHKPRSPQWMSLLGLEWLFRLISEPARLWRRYLLENLPFIWLVLKTKLTGQPDPYLLEPPPEKGATLVQDT